MTNLTHIISRFFVDQYYDEIDKRSSNDSSGRKMSLKLISF